MHRISRLLWVCASQPLMFAAIMTGANPRPSDAGTLAGVCGDAPFGSTGGELDSSTRMEADGASRTVTIRLAPYAWLTSSSGSKNIRGIEFDADLSFREVLEDSDSVIGLMGALDVEIGALVFQFNGAYAGAEQSNESARAIGLNGTANAVVDSTMGNMWLEFLAGYRFIDRPFGEGHRFSVDAFGGIRYTQSETDLSVVADAEITLPSGETLSANTRRDLERSRDWIEPFIGARANVALDGGWIITLRGDVGGFGIDGASFAWQVFSAVGHEWSFDGGAFGLFAGYRALGQDYEEDGFAWDVITHGPLFGLSLRFEF